ncbi:MAG: M42 family peptidase [Candidatus Latescibacteria bacterium]|nr:M42 family peptidase [Candidatus Latescibacterota bacterium]
MNRDLLEAVCKTPGIPGYEDEIQDVVQAYLNPICDEVSRDRVGNVIGLKRATHPPTNGDRPLRVILAAHADEVGMMVKHIDADGFIRFQPVGGLNPQVLVSQRVIIHSKKKVNGVIVPRRAGHPLPTLDEMLIDVGLPRANVCEAVQVGDIVTFASEFAQLNDKVYIGRNFDDRIGTYCMLDAMEHLGPTSVDVYAVSSVQEEMGVRGMPMAAYAIEPDIGLALDGSVTWGAHIPKHEHICAMGEGTGIYIIDNLTIGDRRLVYFLFDLCEKNNITYQRNIGGGTDASAIQRTKSGALSTTVGAPVRYMHSTVQLCHEDDIEATVALLKVFLEHAHELDF